MERNYLPKLVLVALLAAASTGLAAAEKKEESKHVDISSLLQAAQGVMPPGIMDAIKPYMGILSQVAGAGNFSNLMSGIG